MSCVSFIYIKQKSVTAQHRGPEKIFEMCLNRQSCPPVELLRTRRSCQIVSFLRLPCTTGAGKNSPAERSPRLSSSSQNKEASGGLAASRPAPMSSKHTSTSLQRKLYYREASRTVRSLAALRYWRERPKKWKETNDRGTVTQAMCRNGPGPGMEVGKVSILRS